MGPAAGHVPVFEFWQFMTILFVVGFVLVYWWIIAIVLCALVGAFLSWYAYEHHKITATAKAREFAGVAARADEQHQWVMSGDERGLYGTYPPAAV
jgi:hypothetical protein